MDESSSKRDFNGLFVLGDSKDPTNEEYINNRFKFIWERNLLHELPEELRRKVVDYLDTKSSYNLSQVSKQDNDFVYDDLERKKNELCRRRMEDAQRSYIIMANDFLTYNPRRNKDDEYLLIIEGLWINYNYKTSKYYIYDRKTKEMKEIYLLFDKLDELNSTIESDYNSDEDIDRDVRIYPLLVNSPNLIGSGSLQELYPDIWF